MDKVEVLPSTPGTYWIQTCSGTVGIISRYSEGTTWERSPAATTTMVGTYDFQPVPVTLTNEDWKMGGRGSSLFPTKRISPGRAGIGPRNHLYFRTDARMTLDPDAGRERVSVRDHRVIRSLRQAVSVFQRSHV